MRQVIFAIAPIAFFLTACTEYGRPGSSVWLKQAPPEVVASHYQGVCQNYGLTPGTEAMAECIGAEVRAAKASNDAKAVAYYASGLAG